MTIKEEINDLRKKLDYSVTNGESYDKVYKLSTDLDKLIEKYYKETIKA